MSSLVINALSLTIGLFFILIGTIKLTPALNEQIYREIRKNFIRQATILPSVAGWRMTPHMYRKIHGTLEIACGAILAFFPGQIKQVANMVLLILMFGAAFTHYLLNDQMDKMTPSIVFSLLLVCRLVIYAQLRSDAASKAAATGSGPSFSRFPLATAAGGGTKMSTESDDEVEEVKKER